MAITGILDLDGIIGGTTALTSLTVSGTSDLGADVTTTGDQTYTGAVTLSGAARTLTARNGAGVLQTVWFGSTVDGGTQDLTITGNLDLDGTATNLPL